MLDSKGIRPHLLDHLSLSNPNSTHTSPKLYASNSQPHMNINSIFSPPSNRRTTAPMGIPNRSQPSDAMTYTGGDYVTSSSLPSTSHLMGYGQQPTTSAMVPVMPQGGQLTRRSHSSGYLRPSLVRQHRSFDDYLPTDPYNFAPGGTTDFPVHSVQQQIKFQQHQVASSAALGSNYPAIRSTQPMSSSLSGGLPSTSYGGYSQQQQHQHQQQQQYSQQQQQYSQQQQQYSQHQQHQHQQYPLSYSSGGQPLVSSSSYHHPSSQPLHVSTSGAGPLSSGPLSGPAPSWTATNAPAVPYTSFSRDPYNMPVPVLQREFELLKREYDTAIQKLNSSMNSIKTFWSPELKRERALRKEEVTKLAILNEQIRMANQDNQKHTNMVRQLQSELQCQYDIHRTIRDTDIQTVPRDEYNALRMERDRMQREMQLAKDTVRELEVQIESQRQTLMARDESIRKLLDMLQGKGLVPYNAAQERIELENAKTRVIDLESRTKHMEQTISQKEADIRSLQDECLGASEKMRQIQAQCDWLQKMPPEHKEQSAYQTMVDAKDSKIIQLEKELVFYQQEARRLREDSMSAPRNFTDKLVSSHEYSEMKLKMEKADLELSHKHSEMSALQTRLMTAEEQVIEFKRQLSMLRESSSARDNQAHLMQSDVEALRAKLESKNDTIEQKTALLNQTQQEVLKLEGEGSDLKEQIKIKDGKLGMQQRKMDGLEELVKEKEQLAESLKQRLQASPAVQQQRQIQDQLEEMIRERDRIGREMREQRDALENERLEQLELHRREVRDLRLAIESLQKEISDRQVLIESQNEKIADLNREVNSLRTAAQAGLSYKPGEMEKTELERLTHDLHQARSEVDKLLKMVQGLEKDKEQLSTRVKDVQRQLDEAHRSKPLSAAPWSGLNYGDSSQRRTGDSHIHQKDMRIDELEEALRESVSITAERELAIAQQKQIGQQMEIKVNEYRSQLSALQRQYGDMNSRLSSLNQEQHDRDSLVRSLKHERRKHLHEVLQLKQEALVAAISEKDAHIALLEMNNRAAPDELHTLKKHKEKLMRKLKEENERRVQLLNEHKEMDGAESSLAKDLKASPVEQLVTAIRSVELQKKKLRVFIDQLVACILELDPNILTGLPRTQQSQGIEVKMLKKLTRNQLLLELQTRDNDSLQLQHYAHELLVRLSQTQPGLARRALKLLDSLDSPQANIGALFGPSRSARRSMPRRPVQGGDQSGLSA